MIRRPATAKFTLSPRVRKSTGTYPPNWPEIARTIKDAAEWRCVRCGRAHDPANGYTLTVHHLDMDPSNCVWWNLPPLCQRCHLRIQGRVRMNRPWMFDHSAWFQPYVAGFYAWKYLGEQLNRADVEARIDELLMLERRALFGTDASVGCPADVHTTYPNSPERGA